MQDLELKLTEKKLIYFLNSPYKSAPLCVCKCESLMRAEEADSQHAECVRPYRLCRNGLTSTVTSNLRDEQNPKPPRLLHNVKTHKHREECSVLYRVYVIIAPEPQASVSLKDGECQ